MWRPVVGRIVGKGVWVEKELSSVTADWHNLGADVEVESRIYVYMYKYICIYVYAYKYMHVCTYICMYIYI